MLKNIEYLSVGLKSYHNEINLLSCVLHIHSLDRYFDNLTYDIIENIVVNICTFYKNVYSQLNSLMKFNTDKKIISFINAHMNNKTFTRLIVLNGIYSRYYLEGRLGFDIHNISLMI